MMVTFMMNDPQKRGSIKRDLRLKLDSWTRYEFFLFILNWLASSLTSVLKHTLFPIVFSHYATKSKSCHHHTNFLIHTSSTCRVEKKRVQSFEIIIFVDTLISFVFKLDKRHLNGQKENAIVILYTLQVLKTNKIELKLHNKLDEVIKRDCAFLFSFLIYFFCLLTKRLLTRCLSNIYKSFVNHFLRLHFSFSSFTWLFPPEIAMTWYDHTFFHLRHCLLLHGNKH